MLWLNSACGRPPLKGADQPISLGVLGTEDNLPFYIAEKEDLFRKNGSEVKLVSFNSARERDLALEAGAVQGELADLIAVGLLIKNGTPVKIISIGLGATPQEGRFALLASPQSNIFSAGQLKGIPIAISSHTIIEFMAEKMLAIAGLKPDDVKFVYIPDLNMRLDALLAGRDINAALLPDPQASLAELNGAKVILDDTKISKNLSQTVIIFREETLRENPEGVKAVLLSYREGAKLLNRQDSGYKDLIIEKARIPSPLRFSYLPPRFSHPVLPSPEMIEEAMTWMVQKGLIPQPYTYADLTTPAFLPAADKESP